MKSKIFLSMLVIVFSVSLVVSGTMAWFTDSETNTGNTFAAGKLDLELGSMGSLPFSLSDLKPGDSGQGSVTLTNTQGSINGQLSVNLANLVQSENDMVEPELQAGDYMNGGDLHLFLQLAAFIDVNKDGVFNEGDIQLAYDGQMRAYPGWREGALLYSGVNSMMPAWNNIMMLAGGDSVDLVIAWQFPTESQDANYSQNIAMTDSLGFDVEMALEQAQAIE